jgi:hypothetical protein
MIIIDYNQVAISNLMEQIGSSKDPVDENLVRHMILNTIRNYVKKFRNDYGSEIVIACDSRKYWRKDIFEYYKASRKKTRETSGHDWTAIFDCLGTIKEELKQYSPYKVLEVPTCEADDIISVLTENFHAEQKVMIISSDKDFCQLQKFSNVIQYSPTSKKIIKENFPELHLKQLIIRGDRSDGIPNILSPDDVFISGTRQKPIMEAKLINWLNQQPQEFCDEKMLINFKRNQQLIDLTFIPENLKTDILNHYHEQKPKTKTEFMNYMIKYKLKNLIELLGEF